MNTAYLFTLFLILSATSFAQTTQDSLDLYNQTLVVMKYFEDHGYVKSGTSYRYGSAFEKLDNAYEKFLLRKDSTKTDMGKVKLLVKDYRNTVDRFKFYQRETKDRIIDLRAPMMLYDRRIHPTACYRYKNVTPEDTLFGDIINIVGYDTLLIKPSSMLTDEEEQLRDEKYHILDSIDANTFSVVYPTTLFITEVQSPKYATEYDDDKKSRKSVTPYVVRIYYDKLGHYISHINLDPVTLEELD